MAVSIPHFAAQFQLGRHGSAVVEQDSPGDLQARAFNVLVCPAGFREDEPEFGRPELLFKALPVNTRAIQDALARWAGVDAAVSDSGAFLEPWVRNIIAEVS